MNSLETVLPKSFFYESKKPLNNLYEIHSGYLKTSGWLESKSKNESIRNDSYVPWISYPALEVIEQMNLSNKRIVEFGSGASTLYFSNRCKELISYEFDDEWFNLVSKSVSQPNVLIKNRPSKEKSNTSIDVKVANLKEWHLDFTLGGFRSEDWALDQINDLNMEIASDLENTDFVFIDGGPRNAISEICAKYSSPGTVILLDNADQPYLEFARNEFKSQAFVEFPFTGLSPLNPYATTTSFFIKDLQAWLSLFPHENEKDI
jgi:predicted O-methyltransferase YrrM